MLSILAAAALAVDPLVLEYLKYALYDVDSAKVETVREPCVIPIRDNWGKPTAKKPATTTKRMHFIKLNAKNRLGGYTGWKEQTLVERDGKVVSMRDSFYDSDEVEDNCPLAKGVPNGS
jgi:hypothetical protein